MGVVGYTSCTAVHRTSGHCKQTSPVHVRVNTRVRPWAALGWGRVGSGLQILIFSKSLLKNLAHYKSAEHGYHISFRLQDD